MQLRRYYRNGLDLVLLVDKYFEDGTLDIAYILYEVFMMNYQQLQNDKKFVNLSIEERSTIQWMMHTADQECTSWHVVWKHM